MHTRFFIPTKKETEQTQVTFDVDANYDEKLTLDQLLEKKSVDALLMQSFQTSGPFEKFLMQNSRSYLLLNLHNFKDEIFDPLTIPNSCYDDIKAALFYELNYEGFVLSTQNGVIGNYHYHPNVFPLLDSLETGIVTPLFYAFLSENKFSGYSEGKIVTQVTDYRFTQPRKSFIFLSIDEKIFQQYIDSKYRHMTNNDRILAEQKTLLMMNPAICTDPNPDVSRLSSIMDENKKIWKNTRQRTEREFKNIPKPPAPARSVVQFNRENMPEKVYAISQISSIIAANCRIMGDK